MQDQTSLNLKCIRLSNTGNTSQKCCKRNVKLSTRGEQWCRESIIPISGEVPRVPLCCLKNSWCRYLNVLLNCRRRNGCNCVKHKYHYGMTRADFINRFENNIMQIDAVLVKVFINNHNLNNNLIMKWFILICSI